MLMICSNLLKNEDMAIKLTKDVTGICEREGFKLTKFIGNSRKIPATIPRRDSIKR